MAVKRKTAHSKDGTEQGKTRHLPVRKSPLLSYSHPQDVAYIILYPATVEEAKLDPETYCRFRELPLMSLEASNPELTLESRDITGRHVVVQNGRFASKVGGTVHGVGVSKRI